MNTPATPQSDAQALTGATEPPAQVSEVPPTHSEATESPSGAAHMSTPFDILARNPRSLRAAINAKCWDCIGAGADPAPRRLIRECGCTTCPLYAVRPYQHQTSEG